MVIDNMSLFGTEDIDEAQEMYEEMTKRGRRIVCEKEREDEDTYAVNSWETFVDLCDEGFVIIDGRLCRRD